MMQHQPYSPDLASMDNFQFPKVKLQLKVARFDTITVIQKAMTNKLQVIPKEDFSNTMKKLEKRAKQCIALNGFYFE
jgi:hypothetical protein